MYVEYPVREEHVKAFMNMPVGVVLTDGTRHYGVLTGCEKGCLILNGSAAVKRKKGAKKAGVSAKAGKRKRVASNVVVPSPFIPALPYPPYGPILPPGPRLALDLATIALLFALLP